MTPAERLRQHQRSLQKAQRELERERSNLEQQEKSTMADIKKNAKAGNMVSVPCLTLTILRQVKPASLISTERMQNTRKRPRTDTAVHAKVYADAGTATGGVVADANAKE